MRQTKIVLFVISLTTFISCGTIPRRIETASGGVRLKNPKALYYNRKRFDNNQLSKLDTNAIYVHQYSYCKGDTSNLTNRVTAFYRFFSGRQLLVYYDYKVEANFDQVYDPKAGIAGYFYVKESFLRLEHWTNGMSDQTPKVFGIVLNDSMLKFYNSSLVRDCHFSFKRLEKENCYSIWKRVKVADLPHFDLDW